MKIYKPNNGPKWYITFYHNDKRRRVAVSTNLKATEKIATAVDGMLACNGSLTPDLQIFVETMNPKLRDKLISFGVIGREYMPSIHAGKTLQDHVRDFGESLRAKGNGQQYAGHIERSIGRIFAACGFVSIPDLDAHELYTHLADMRGPDGIGERTFNSYLKACRQFARWLVRERRADTNPIEHLSICKEIISAKTHFSDI